MRDMLFSFAMKLLVWLITLLVLPISGLFFWIGWNHFMPAVFGLTEVSFTQSMAAILIFSSFNRVFLVGSKVIS